MATKCIYFNPIPYHWYSHRRLNIVCHLRQNELHLSVPRMCPTGGAQSMHLLRRYLARWLWIAAASATQFRAARRSALLPIRWPSSDESSGSWAVYATGLEGHRLEYITLSIICRCRILRAQPWLRLQFIWRHKHHIEVKKTPVSTWPHRLRDPSRMLGCSGLRA